IALGLSIAGNVGQALTYESRAVIAKADVAQAKLDMIEMNNKRDLAKAEFEKLRFGLSEIKDSVTEAQQSASSPQTEQTLKNVENKINNLEQATQATAENLDKSESSATTHFRGKLATAEEKEREGFQNLIKGDYDGAIKSFQDSEDSFNSYHNAYDIAKLLKENKSQLDDPAVKKEVFKTIVNKHAYGAPPDLFKEVKVIANQ
ncbi:MAG: hypothetical protein ABI646_08630, partial [Acidobacteriota bacterium]